MGTSLAAVERGQNDTAIRLAQATGRGQLLATGAVRRMVLRKLYPRGSPDCEAGDDRALRAARQRTGGVG
jgi:hypothetical protein